MDTFNKATYFDPLFYALGGQPGKLQNFVDAVLADYNDLMIDGFDFNEDLLDDFTYEQVEKYVGIAPLAAVVDPDSDPIPFKHEGQSIGTGKIPRMKAVDYLNEAKIRTLKKLIRRNDVTAQMIKDSAGSAVGNIFVSQVESFKNALSFQRNQMVSTGGIRYTSTNNPYGIALDLSARVPAGNITVLADAYRWWTASGYATEGANADPIQDMKDMVEVARRKGVRACHFEVNSEYLDKILGHSKVVADLKERFSLSATYSVSSLKPFSRSEQIAALSSLVGKEVREIDHLANVEYVSGGKIAERTLDGFAKDVVVLVPDGKIGEILTVEPLLVEGGNYAFGFGRKLAFTIEADYTHKCQSYTSELTSLCVPDKPKWMWYLKPNEL